MKTRSYYLIFLLLSVVILACTKSNEIDLGGIRGGANCDTVNMKLAVNVRPILQANCFSCHGNGIVNGGVTLDTYAGVKAVADNGKLIGTITHASGFPPMPQTGIKLSDCNINKIRAWINRGAKND
ncbi:MAG: cytochrome c [Chitinophagaceae bacterium]